MTIIDREFDRLAQSVHQTLITHQQQLQQQQAQIKSLTQLLNSCRNTTVEPHSLSAIDRLTELLDLHQQGNDRVCSILTTLTQAKDAEVLTIDSQGEMATSLKLELTQLAQRLGIESVTKLSKAAHRISEWSKLMSAHPDADGYQWQFPGFKRGFYHNTRLQIVGTKPVAFAAGSSLN
ncbi:hypothetical protein [Chamaesiphon polymorphus]|uniref:Uncharacterized protein n=1 Tax=Chamaesiphon polymorphus CCALA 037 TaxID=2107692 RepID=A0A2T1F5U4_9CYAN|nr:hypothetical protein [Chamaesiphon polymorphus]PSB40306.1 hypothetical protein C7B77_28530 [Chamaesiphon polymorphus CCALA 037]